MRIHAITFAGLSPTTSNVQLYTKIRDLSAFGFLKRSTIKELMKFVSRTAIKSMKPGSRCSAKNEDQMVHILVSEYDLFAVYVFASLDYPKRLAYSLLNQALKLFQSEVGQQWKTVPGDQDFPVAGLKDLFKQYKTGANDNLIRAQNNVDEIHEMLVGNMRELLEHQGDIDTLVEQSDDLKAQTKVFFKNSKKMNSCCTLI